MVAVRHKSGYPKLPKKGVGYLDTNAKYKRTSRGPWVGAGGFLRYSPTSSDQSRNNRNSGCISIASTTSRHKSTNKHQFENQHLL